MMEVDLGVIRLSSLFAAISDGSSDRGRACHEIY